MENTTPKKYQLPKEFTEKWLHALRSGEYAQTTETLYDEEDKGFCCLGVACVISGIPRSKLVNFGLPRELPAHRTEELLATNFPATLLQRDNDLIEILTSLNDGYLIELRHEIINENRQKYSFNEIADWIEANCELI